MSNAMRSGKRLLAGVAAGALGASVLTFAAVAAAPAASAASLTASTSPVRVTFAAGPALENVPYAAITWTASASTGTGDTAVVTLASAPSPSAQLSIGDIADIGTQVTNSSNSITSGDDTLTLAGTKTGGNRTYVTATGTSAGLAVAANTAGVYAGTIQAYVGGNLSDTISFSFTTVGKATSMTLTPATQATAVSGTAPLTATLKDATGANTQPLWVDQVLLTVTGTNSFSNGSSSITNLTGSGSGASSLFDGAASFFFVNGGTGGVYSATATPAGTLGSAGVTAQSASITVSGSVSPSAVASLVVTSPDTGDDTGTQPATGTQVPTGTSSITVAVTGQTAQAGATVYLKGVASAGTPTSAAPAIVPVTLGANSKGVATFTLGGSAAAAGSWLYITQVEANGVSTVSGVNLSIQQVDRALTYITPTPGGTIVTTLGTSTTVAVETLDQFLAPVAGATVQARRASASGALLSSGVTNAAGVATVTVSPVSGLTSGSSETYYFNAIPIGGSQVNGTAAEALTVTYTTGGTTTSMSVAIPSTSGASQPITNTSTAPTLIPAVYVPYGGIVNQLSSGVWSTTLEDTTVAIGAGNAVSFIPTPLPGGLVTVTAPEGVKLNILAPSATRLWSSGSQSITVNSGQTVYAFATKTGVHDIVFKSGDITATAKIKALTPPQAAYNILLDPATKTVATSTFDRVTLTVTDVFGNPVPNTTTANGMVLVKATGQILLGGLSTGGNYTTGADGSVVVSIIADNDSGEGIVTAEPGVLTNAWLASGYVPPVGANAPVKSARSVITVSSAATKSIVIAGERGTVSGKPGILVDGTTTGLVGGAKVKPWLRFPGQAEYEVGSARPTVGATGDFEWQRKTGKKVYVYFTSEDDAVKSNRIIIQAN